jgi:methyl-accepting chemotaxis protein
LPSIEFTTKTLSWAVDPGESGRGFAVVASEVKELANQTRQATTKTSTRIQGIQDQVQSAVEAFDTIPKELSGVSSNSTDVAAVVQQQSSVILHLDEASRALADSSR